MKLPNLLCPSCGNSFNVIGDEIEFICKNCQKNILGCLQNIVNEGKSYYESKITKLKKDKLYFEAYEYCKKALEIYPNFATFWEDRALCILDHDIYSLERFDSEKIKEVVYCLNESKRIDPHSRNYKLISSYIANKIFDNTNYKYNSLFRTISPNSQIDYSLETEKEMINCFELFYICNKISTDFHFLYRVYDIFIEDNWINKKWIRKKYYNSDVAKRHKFDAANMLYNMRLKCESENTNIYEKRERKTVNMFVIMTIISIILFIILLVKLT